MKKNSNSQVKPCGYIYKCTYKKNGKIYIGQKNQPKVKEAYYGRGSLWKKEVLSKCDKEKDIDREILEWCYSFEELNEREQYWIKYFNSTDLKIGYNIQKGGHINNLESRLKISGKLKDVMKDISIREKISNSMKKRYREVGFSEEHRSRLSESQKGKKRPNVNCDSRSVSVCCDVDGQTLTFHNKQQAAQWWFDHFPFSNTYSVATYIRKINDSILGKRVCFKGKEINTKINWRLNEAKD